jgi:hypothetical protein
MKALETKKAKKSLPGSDWESTRFQDLELSRHFTFVNHKYYSRPVCNLRVTNFNYFL